MLANKVSASAGQEKDWIKSLLFFSFLITPNKDFSIFLMTQVNPDLQAKPIQAPSSLNKNNIKVADILQLFSLHPL